MSDLGKCLKAIADALKKLDKLKYYADHPRLARRIYGDELSVDAERLAKDISEMLIYCPRIFGGVGTGFDGVLEEYSQYRSLGWKPEDALITAVRDKPRWS